MLIKPSTCFFGWLPDVFRGLQPWWAFWAHILFPTIHLQNHKMKYILSCSNFGLLYVVIQKICNVGDHYVPLVQFLSLYSCHCLLVIFYCFFVQHSPFTEGRKTNVIQSNNSHILSKSIGYQIIVFFDICPYSYIDY